MNTVKPNASATARHTPFLRKLLVAIAEPSAGDPAVTFAIELAVRLRSRIEFCTVLDRSDAIAPAQPYDALHVLDHVRERAIAAGLEAASCALEGTPADAIAARGAEGAFDAVVIGNSHKTCTERAFRGSVADGVLRASTIPVFVAPAGAGVTNAGRKRVFVAVDDSSPSDDAVGFGIDYAAAAGATLTFCTVSDSAAIVDKAEYYGTDLGATLAELHAASKELLQKAADRAAARNVPCESVVTSGPPANQILRMAASRRADAIVMGTHGRRGVRRFFLGSVAESVIRRSVVPVAVIRGGR